MVRHGLLSRLKSKPGKDDDLEAFLKAALPLARREPRTTAWFALRFGRSSYGIFDAFPDEAGLMAHINGAMANSMRTSIDHLLEGPPDIQRLSIFADKLDAGLQGITKGVLLTLAPKAGKEQDLEALLRSAKGYVVSERDTIDWFAFQMDNREYGIFDVFPDSSARLTHLVGHVPRELARHSSLLGAFPHLNLVNVLAAKPD